MSTIPTILTFDWVKVMVRLITAYWVAFTLLVIGGLVVTLFRRRFLYGKFRYELTRPGTWNPTLSLGDFVDELLMQPCSRKQKISHDVVNDIYLTRFEDESIGIKKMKETTLMFRIFLQVVTRGPRWFIRHTVLERSITLAQCKTGVTERAAEDGGILFEQNHVQVLIGSTRPGFEDLNAKLLDAILLNVPECKIKAAGKSNDLRRAVFKRLLKPIVQFVRGAGYLYSRRLVAKETDWANRTFFQTVVAIGSTLDPAIFRIRIRLAQTSPNLSLPIPKPDLVIVEYRSSSLKLGSLTFRCV